MHQILCTMTRNCFSLQSDSINGRPTPLTQVRELGQLLVDIHGQHEHQRLLKKEHHRTLLDEFAAQSENRKSIR